MQRWLVFILLCTVACDDDDTGPAATSPVWVDPAPATAAAGEVLTLRVDVTAPDEALTVTVTRGGGQVAATVTSGPDGVAEIPWTLGVVPVDNAIEVARAAAPDETLTVTVRATLETPWSAEVFGDVHGWLNENGYRDSGSTEDLTFTAEGLLMGAPEGLIHVAPDGTVTRRPVDEGVDRIWGFTVDAKGDVWGIDPGGSRLVRIEPDGAVHEALTTNGETELSGPNYVAVDHQGLVYVSDPCLGQIIRLDPASGDIAVHQFDLATEGGPNGMAITADGTQMYTVTENTGLLCSHADIPIRDEIAGLYAIDLDAFGTHTAIAPNEALFGDGLAFDAEGNLYVVYDWVEGIMISSSAVVVYPAGEAEGVKLIEADPGQLIANVAFGEGEYGETTLYMALLALPVFTDPSSRGLTRLEVGIRGLPLLPGD